MVVRCWPTPSRVTEEAPICSTTIIPLPYRATYGPCSRPAAWCCPPDTLLSGPQPSLGARRLYARDYLGSPLFVAPGCSSALLWLWLWLSNVRQDRHGVRQRNIWWASDSAQRFQTSICVSARQLAYRELTARVPGCSDFLTCKQTQSFLTGRHRSRFVSASRDSIRRFPRAMLLWGHYDL